MIVPHKISFLAMSSLATIALASVSAAPAYAQVDDTAVVPQDDAVEAAAPDYGLEAIVVTAQRREESLQDVPIAVSAVTAQALEQRGIEGTASLPQVIPSIQFTRSGASGLFFVRGVGTTNAAVGEDGANAFYVDGVYMADLAQTVSEFNNIERIEVLKGPQGTLFGRNAFGGLVHIITKDPGDTPELKGEIGYANYDRIHSKLYAAGPITDNISADVAFTQAYQGDGWGRNVTLDKESKRDEFIGVRSKVVMRPSDAVKLTFAGDYFEREGDLSLGWKIARGTVGLGGQTGPRGSHDTSQERQPNALVRNWGLSMTGEFDLGFATLTSITAYRNSVNNSNFDADAGEIPWLWLSFDSTAKSFQQELRLASNDTEPLSWQVGAFYLNSSALNDSDMNGNLFAGNSQNLYGDMSTDSYALFGEATYAITPTTRLTGGIRFTADRRGLYGTQTTYDGTGAVVVFGEQDSKLSYDEITYRAAIRQDITDDINIYASINRGFKAGTYSLQNPLYDPVQPQYVMAYEAGVKAELFDRSLRISLSGYHYDIDDYQVNSAAASAPGTTAYLNAAKVKVDGIDFEFEAAPTREWRLFGGMSYIDSRFDKFGGAPVDKVSQAPFSYPRYPGQTALTTCPDSRRGSKSPGVRFNGTPSGGYFTCYGDASGNRTPMAPEFTASLGSSYTMPVGATGELRLTALYSYNSGYVFEPDNFMEQDDFHLLNASMEYRPNENLGIEIWGNNLTDTDYAVLKFSSATGTREDLGSPQTYGVNLKFDF